MAEAEERRRAQGKPDQPATGDDWATKSWVFSDRSPWAGQADGSVGLIVVGTVVKALFALLRALR